MGLKAPRQPSQELQNKISLIELIKLPHEWNQRHSPS